MESRLLGLNRLFSRLPAMMIRQRWPILLFIAVFSLLMAWITATRTSLDMTLDNFIDQDDPAIRALDEFRSQFGSDDSVYLVYRARDGDVFSAQSLRAVQSLTRDLQNWQQLDPGNLPRRINGNAVNLQALEQIRRVQSLSTLRIQRSDNDTLRSTRLVPEEIPEDPAALQDIRDQAMAEPDLLLAWYSPDGRYAALRIQTHFGAEPMAHYVPAVDQADVGLDVSFGAFDDGDDFDLAYDETATVDEIPFATVDMFEYSRFFTAVRALYAGYEQQLEFHPVGNPPLMDWLQQTLRQMIWLGVGVVMIVVLLLWTLFRSLSAVIWPVVTIGLSLLWTWGLITAAGFTLSTLISLTCLLIFAVGIADCVHVLSAYFSQRKQGQPHPEALAAAYDKTGLAIFITSLTTICGLLALTSSGLIPIQVFGLMSALGVFMAFFFSVVLLPILLDFWPPGRRQAPPTIRQLQQFWKRSSRNRQWLLTATGALLLLLITGPAIGGYLLLVCLLLAVVVRHQDRILAACPDLVARRPLTIFTLFLALFGLTVYGASQVNIDSNISELTRADSEPRQAYQTVDEHMAGAQSLSIMIDAGRSEALMEPRLLRAIEQLQQRIGEQYPEQVSRSYSLVNIIKDTYRVMNEDDPAYHRLPDSEVTVAQLLYLFNSANPEERRSIVSDDYSRSHISLNAYNAGSWQYQQFFEELGEEIDQAFAPVMDSFPELEVQVTGTVPLMMRAMDEIAQSQYRSFALALAVISIIMILTLGSLQAGLIAMIPNLIPPMFAFGLMGLLGIPLDTDTLLIAPVIIGIAVDDTIHFMTHYRLALARTGSMEQALRSTVTTVGRAVMFTTMILGLGFAILAFSDYLGIAKIGIFGSMAMLVALLCDLFLLPAMILLFKPRFGMKSVDRRFSAQGEPA